MASREQALQEFAETFVHWLSVGTETEESLVAA
jgi:hypothetical protein